MITRQLLGRVVEEGLLTSAPVNLDEEEEEHSPSFFLISDWLSIYYSISK